MLGVLASEQPGLRFVDFIPFSVRARTLFSSSAVWVHPLYPVGYPALLRLGHALTGDVLLAGKALSVLGGALAVGAMGRWVSPWVGLWLLAQPALLQWGATEGTDTLAAAFCISALAAARTSPVAAGVLLGAGCLTRYTAVTAAPVVLWLSGARLSTLLAFGASTAPHWAVALWTGASLLPDQSENIAIGGHTGSMLSWPFLAQLPGRLWMSAFAAVHHPATAVGLLGLLVGAWRRDRRAGALLLAAFLHVAAVSLAFSNDRLVLPATLMMAGGLHWLLPRGWLALPAAAVSLWLALPAVRTPSPTVAQLTAVVSSVEGLEGPFLTTSPWFYSVDDGWVTAGILVRRIPGDPRRLTPEAARAWAAGAGVKHFAVAVGRVRRSYPGLAPLLGRRIPEGYRKVGRSPGWLVFAFED